MLAVAAVAKSGKTYTGKCLCGAVSFRAAGLSDIWYCHCKQCQKLTGHFIAAAGVKRANLDIAGEVNWLPISEETRSGHCKTCGCYMFWDSEARSNVSVLMGCLDDTDGLDLKGHIFVQDKADYFEISDGLPQYKAYPPGGTRKADEA